MRRWHFLSRLRRLAGRADSARCFLAVEQLEAREVLSPTVFAPNFGSIPQTQEGFAFTFSGSNSFFVSDESNSVNYSAVLTATHGIISVTPIPNLTVTNNGTATVTLTGSRDDINSLLSSGVTFQPTPYYSGDANVALSATDLTNGGPPGENSVNLKVQPVVSNSSLTVQAANEVWAPSSGFAFPAGFASVSPWPDLDGSETATITFSLNAANPDAFTLAAGGTALNPIEPGLWQISATDPVALQATLDSLTLTPPAGFSGRVELSIFGTLRDSATFSVDQSSTTRSRFLGAADVALRYFVGSSVTTPPVFGVEGGSIDLGGRFVASDPDEMPGDVHTLALRVPGGTLTFNPALVPEGVSVERDVVPDGSTTVLVTGSISGINQFLAASGSLTYAPGSAFFSGVVPLSITLTNTPVEFVPQPPDQFGPPRGPNNVVNSPNGPAPQFPEQPAAPGAFAGVSPLSFVPVADHVFPSAVDVTTDQDTPVALSVSVSSLADTDGSESVLIVLGGVPAGATLNHGTDLGGGQWALSPADLSELIFTPPPGESGIYTITVKVIVTDSAPSIGRTDTATESTTFNVTVVPAAVPVAPLVAPRATPPAVVQNLPPASTPAAVLGITSTSTPATSTGGTTTANTENAQEIQVRTRPATFDGYSSGSNTESVGPTETRVSYSPQAQGTVFSQVEVSLPTYASGEKHPLPPVLPLDQTLPVAGFSESGGDSFALIDKLYRDSAGNSVSAKTTPAEAPASLPVTFSVLALSLVSERVTIPPFAVAPESNTETGKEEAAPIVAEPQEGNWPTWVAGSAVAVALAAWAWMTRGSESRLTRGVLRFFRALHRRPTQRTA